MDDAGGMTNGLTAMGCTDFRYRWLSETMSKLMGIFDTKYADAIIDEHGEQIRSFFDEEITEFTHIHRQILFIWRTFYDKMVEETITVLEEGKFELIMTTDFLCAGGHQWWGMFRSLWMRKDGNFEDIIFKLLSWSFRRCCVRDDWIYRKLIFCPSILSMFSFPFRRSPNLCWVLNLDASPTIMMSPFAINHANKSRTANTATRASEKEGKRQRYFSCFSFVRYY